MRHHLCAVGGALACSVSSSAGVLNDDNLIVLNNLDSNSEVKGRTFVGGSIVGADSSK